MNTTTWRKSSRSATDQCVELHRTLTHVRDSKNPTGPTLRVNRGFVTWVKQQQA